MEPVAEMTRTSALANIHGHSIDRQRGVNLGASKSAGQKIQLRLCLKGVRGSLPFRDRPGVPEFMAKCKRMGLKQVYIADEELWNKINSLFSPSPDPQGLLEACVKVLDGVKHICLGSLL